MLLLLLVSFILRDRLSFCCCIFGRGGGDRGGQLLSPLSSEDDGKDKEDSNSLRFLNGKEPSCLELIILRGFPRASVVVEESEDENLISSTVVGASAAVIFLLSGTIAITLALESTDMRLVLRYSEIDDLRKAQELYQVEFLVAGMGQVAIHRFVSFLQ